MILSRQCLVCGLPLAGAVGSFLRWFGIRRSSRNPNCCTRCNTHVEDGALVEITMVFADLSSFTELTNKMGASSTFDLVDQYLRLAAEILARHGAFIDKYIGDAVMAFFNVPIKRPDHARLAVAAAQELQKKIPVFSERLGVRLQCSIGIATGFARVGRLGSDDVKDYTAIGAVVNQAARLQSQAQAGEILITEEVYRRIAGEYPDLPREDLALKGFHEVIPSYRISHLAKPPPPLSTGALPTSGVLGVWAILMAMLGAGCMGSSLLGAVALAFGMGSALAAGALWLDQSSLRLPLLFVTAILASISIFTLMQNARLRREFQARHSCIVDTPGEKRRNRMITALCCMALASVLVELIMHYLHYHTF